MRINIKAINEGLHFKGSGRCSIIHFLPLTFLIFCCCCYAGLKHFMVFYYYYFFAPHQIMENYERQKESKGFPFCCLFIYLFICGFFACLLFLYTPFVVVVVFVKISCKVYHYVEHVMLFIVLFVIIPISFVVCCSWFCHLFFL